ncbi:hypothetical protein [Oceanospirillum beijerinckii]|uniref:hypothetical protein n=1 Tax=Oceanospirillum beijerinckii TaxID=64976 RepID=UPI00042A52CE|nr:hypothetical protein [Oceanospirillum beijerinckii]
MRFQQRVMGLLKHPEMKLFVVTVIFLAISWPVFNQDRLPLQTSFLLISGIWLLTVAMLFLMRRE